MIFKTKTGASFGQAIQIFKVAVYDREEPPVMARTEPALELIIAQKAAGIWFDWIADISQRIEYKYGFSNASIKAYSAYQLAYVKCQRFWTEHAFREAIQEGLIYAKIQFSTRVWC